MARTDSKATVIVAGNTLQFVQSGSYTIEYLPSGNVQIKLDGGKATVIKAADYAAITSFSFAPGADLDSAVRIDGVTFTNNFNTTAADGAFEANHDYRALLGELITDHGIAWTVDNLLVNGSKADTFKLLWDFLDDAYVAGANYYDIALNETFVRLGVKYAEYLDAGGAPLTDVIAKYQPDNNANGIPQREQSMHDNLLGNLNHDSIVARNFGSPLTQQLLALVPQEYEDRAVYSGNEAARGGAAHDAVRAFDYDHGWSRPDYVDRSYDAVIDPLARKTATSMYYGNGNPVDDWNVVRHEGAQIELGLKVKHRGGDEYQEYSIGPDGVATYHVATGTDPAHSARAEWNFDFAATDYSPDHNFTYLVELDVDPGAGVMWSTVYSSAAPDDTKFGTGETFQNSTNVAFYAAGIDTNPGMAGIQPYAFGDGTFNVRISAFDAVTHAFVASNELVVIVGDGNPLI
jgi:hypothetical protein